MNALASLDEMSHEEICAWLKAALCNERALPRLTVDEAPHLAVIRLEKALKPATRDSLRKGSLRLTQEFCASGQGEQAYVEELVGLGTELKLPEFAHMLAALAGNWAEDRVSLETRLSVLAAVVDVPPPQPPEFWNMILQQNKEDFGSLALAGVLQTYPFQAVQMLSQLPQTPEAGGAAALNLDLTWDDLRPAQRQEFVEDVKDTLRLCGVHFAGPVREWLASKGAVREPRKLLKQALSNALGNNFEATTRKSKLCRERQLVAA